MYINFIRFPFSDNVVCIVTRLGAARIGALIPARGTDFLTYKKSRPLLGFSQLFFTSNYCRG